MKNFSNFFWRAQQPGATVVFHSDRTVPTRFADVDINVWFTVRYAVTSTPMGRSSIEAPARIRHRSSSPTSGKGEQRLAGGHARPRSCMHLGMSDFARIFRGFLGA